MKTYILLIFHMLLVIYVQGQNKKNFSKIGETEQTIYYEPAFEKNELCEQKKYLETFDTDHRAMQQWISRLLEQVLSQEEIELLTKNGKASRSTVQLFFDHTGKIGYAKFLLAKQDTTTLNDKKLAQIYQLLKKSTIDTTKKRIVLSRTDRKKEECYFMLVLPLYRWEENIRQKK